MYSVFLTIAFQLAPLQSRLRPHIASAAHEFVKFQSMSLMEQLETLIVAPLTVTQDDISYPSEKPIIIALP
jgi:hypothetical protein